MAITRSGIIAVGSDPGPNDLWSPAGFLRPDWSTNHVVRSSYSTSIDAAQNGREHRRALQDRPRMGLSLPVASIGSGSQFWAWAIAARAAYARSVVPIYPDTIVADGETGFGRGAGVWTGKQSIAFAAGTYLRDRRFFAGQWVVVAKRDWSQTALRYVATIDRGTSTPSLALDSAVDFVAAGTGVADRSVVVVPCVEADPILEADRTLVTRDASKFTLDALETYGASSVPGMVAIGDLAGAQAIGISAHDGIPIFPLDSIDFGQGVRVGVSMASANTDVGLGVITTRWGPRPRQVVAGVWRSLSRDVWSRMQALWDYCGGAAMPFWMVSPANDLEIVDADASGPTVTVVARGDETDWIWRPAVAMVRRSTGDVQVRRVVSVARGGGLDVVTLESGFGFGDGAEDVRRCAGAFIARFAADELEQRWATFEVCDMAFQAMEVTQDEADAPTVTITNIAEVADTLGTIDAAHDPNDCIVPFAYLLTSCIDGTEYSVRSGLEDYVGSVVEFSEFPTECFTVSASSSIAVDYETVTITNDYEDCDGLFCGGCLPGSLSMVTLADPAGVFGCINLVLGSYFTSDPSPAATYSPGHYAVSLRRQVAGDTRYGPNRGTHVVMRCRAPKPAREDVVRIRVTGTATINSAAHAGMDYGVMCGFSIWWRNNVGDVSNYCMTIGTGSNSDGSPNRGTAGFNDTTDFEIVWDWNAGTSSFEFTSVTGLAGKDWVVNGKSSILDIPDAVLGALNGIRTYFYAAAGQSASLTDFHAMSFSNVKIHFDEAVPP